MPVWYEHAQPWIESGRLELIGLTQEQHPARCRLFAQWKRIDVPILWDPFNRNDSRVVPNFVAIDDHGIVRSVDPDPETFEAEFLDVDFPAPAETPAPDPRAGACAFPEEHGWSAPDAALCRGQDVDGSVDALARIAEERGDDARAWFRAGVGFRMRHDSEHARPGDFQAAIDAWRRALELRPNQYIWRRRIQQYGPRMDKPYNFYSWTEEARAEIVARGETPVALEAALTRAELAEPREGAEEPAAAEEPDPEGRIARDEKGRVRVETAVAFDTSGESPIASVHLTARTGDGTKWNHEAGPPLVVWIGGDAPRRLEAAPDPERATTDAPLLLNFELALEPGEERRLLDAYALVQVCEDDGTCRYLRRDFRVAVEAPDGGANGR